MDDRYPRDAKPPRLEWFRNLIRENGQDKFLTEEEIQVEERRLLDYAGIIARIARDQLEEERQGKGEPR